MKTKTTLDFLNKHCKQGQHQNCETSWSGFGFEIACKCRCHLNEKQAALELVREPEANALVESPSSSEGTKENDL